VNLTQQTIGIIAEQRRTELMHDGAQQRLARFARSASPSTATLKRRFSSRRPSPMQVVARILWIGRIRRPEQSRPANTTSAG
jgi:hypothetical protein